MFQEMIAIDTYDTDKGYYEMLEKALTQDFEP